MVIIDHEPLGRQQARDLARSILESGVLTYSVPHVLERLEKHKLTMVDCENVLRGVLPQEAEWENGAWRYRFETPRMCVVLQFLSDEEALVVTAWRVTR